MNAPASTRFEVLAKGKGAAVLALPGRRAPMLLLRHEMVTRLQDASKAAILRIKAGDVDAGAVQTLSDLLDLLMGQFGRESERFTSLIFDTSKQDADRARKDFDDEMAALDAFWGDGIDTAK